MTLLFLQFLFLFISLVALPSLSISSIRRKPVTPGIIVGGGRIGNFLYESNGKVDTLLSRSSTVEQSINEKGFGPIYICTRNDDLVSVISKTPASRRSDLVFLQNGMLEPFLESYDLAENTQGLIYFAVSKKGESPIDGKTDLNSEGLTAITGKWAVDFSKRLSNGGLACHVLDKPTWEVAMFEKLIWISAFMIVGADHGGCTVGEVEGKYKDEVNKIISELANSITKSKGLKFPTRLEDRLCAYARSVSHFPTALKEFQWRNGYFLDTSKSCLSRGEADPSPTHTELLRKLKSELFV